MWPFGNTSRGMGLMLGPIGYPSPCHAVPPDYPPLATVRNVARTIEYRNSAAGWPVACGCDCTQSYHCDFTCPILLRRSWLAHTHGEVKFYAPCIAVVRSRCSSPLLVARQGRARGSA